MAQMTDPHDALLGYQKAYRKRQIAPQRCVLHPELSVLMDSPKNETRLTYALTDNGVVRGIALFILGQPIDGVPCFSVGYAVAERFRQRGVATSLLEKSIDEMREGFRKHMKEFYIEAVVGTSNLASQKVAEKIIAPDSRLGTDKFSGLPALVYVRLIA